MHPETVLIFLLGMVSVWLYSTGYLTTLLEFGSIPITSSNGWATLLVPLRILTSGDHFPLLHRVITMSMSKKEKEMLVEMLTLLSGHILEQSKLISTLVETNNTHTSAIATLTRGATQHTAAIQAMQAALQPLSTKQLLISTPSSTILGFH